jgi:hypothetical protein
MFTFECIVKTGHFGAGSFGERSLRIQADSILDAFDKLRRLPGVKKGALGFAGGSILKVSQVR